MHCESAGEIIDAAIAFGFGEDRDNLGGQQLAVIDQLQDAADIGGMAHWQAMDKALHWGPPLRPRKVNQALLQMLLSSPCAAFLGAGNIGAVRTR